MLHVELEVPQQLRVVQVVRVVRRHWEITEAHHLLAGVGHQRTVDARSPRLQGLLEAGGGGPGNVTGDVHEKQVMF